MREAKPPGEGVERASYHPHPDPMTNADVAARLGEVASLLEEQGANPFRVQAYRHGADTLRALDRPVSAIVAGDGLAGLERLPGIGGGLAASIEQLVTTGRLPLLDRLRGESDPVGLLAAVPGIGPRLADRIHAELDVDSLEDLEAAAYDGRLRSLDGFGEKRLAAIRATLGDLLASRPAPRPAAPPPDQTAVAELLDVDREYRERAAAGSLALIAPRRLNAEGEAWLPVLHTDRGGRHYTALYSNTPRAHELGKTNDWVILYADGGYGKRLCTIVTATHGPLHGRRVIRGREPECLAYYRQEGQPPPPSESD
jgi:hypothetical protein